MTPLPGAKQQAADESFRDGVMRNVTPTAFVVTVILRGFVGGAQRNEQTRSDEFTTTAEVWKAYSRHRWRNQRSRGIRFFCQRLLCAPPRRRRPDSTSDVVGCPDPVYYSALADAAFLQFLVDEAATAFVVHHGATDPSLAVAPQVPASIYYALPKAAERVFGFSEAVYRLPSLLVMLAGLCVIGRIGRALIHPAAGWMVVFACLSLRGFDYQAADARP